MNGKLIEYEHGKITDMMAGGGMAGGVLPPGLDENTLVNVPVKMSDLEYVPLAPTGQESRERKTSFLRKVSSALKSPASSHKEVQIIQMTRGEYLKYWIKGEDGYFLPSVVEPPEGRKKWIRNQKAKTAKWNRNDTSQHGALGAGSFA